MSVRDLLDLTDKGVAVPEAQVFEGRIAENRTGLAPVRVIIPEFDPDLGFGPAPWNPVVRASGLFYPKKGDRAVILRPTRDAIWIASWTPSSNTPDVIYD